MLNIFGERTDNTWRECMIENAHDWPAVLQAQAHLCSREYRMFAADNDDGVGDFFKDSADSCDRALTIWQEEQATRTEAIAALQKQIDGLRADIRLAVAERIDAEANGRIGWRATATALRDFADDDASAWLDW